MGSLASKTPDKVFIAIAGNIGSGKSSLTALLSQRFGWKPFYEIVDTNPYLADFYKDMRRWSFQLQMFFLTRRFQHQQAIQAERSSVIQDRTIYEDAEVFARNLYLQGRMDERDYRTYSEHFELMSQFLRPPDLLVYLHSDVDTLMRRIEARGRDYEKAIPRDYLEGLNKAYELWLKEYKKGPILFVDMRQKDFVNVPKHLEHIASIVAWELERLKNRSQGALPLGAGKPKSENVETTSQLSA